MVPYSELQVTSNFSFLRGGSHPQEYVYAAKACGYRAVAISDFHSLAGVVRAYAAAKEAEIPLIVGARILLYDSIPTNRRAPQPLPLYALKQQATIPSLEKCSFILYPSDRESYGNLCELLSRGKLRAAKGCCFCTQSYLQEFHRGLIATICFHSFPSEADLRVFSEIKDIFGASNLSIAISRTYAPHEQQMNMQLCWLARKLALPLLATNDVYYHDARRKALHDILCCIREGCTLNAAGWLLQANAERYMKPVAEMNRLFAELPEALNRSEEIVERALGFSLSDITYTYPREICPQGREANEYLASLCWERAELRYGTVPKKIKQLLQNELELIRELDYAKYFLSVFSIVCFARSQRILCQGRGAAANSVVCYLLDITSVDPERIDVLLERFISKERNEPPDIDIDFEHERREEVIQYIYQTFGRKRAALTAEVITYRTRSAVRDIAKVFGFSRDVGDAVVRLLSRNDPSSLSVEALKRAGLNPEDRRIRQLLRASLLLKTFPRHRSQHVGGFIISDEVLSRIVPLENAAMPQRTIIEWDKEDIEEMGMLKVDVLGLGMLSCIRKAMELVNVEDPAYAINPLTLHRVPAEDPKVYDMLCAADTIGVFQIESRAQMSMLPRLRPRCFYDLVIEVAIVRPGPIQGKMVHPYLKRRSGEEAVTYPSEEVREILEPTLGVPIFQEQVMRLVVTAADFSLGEADQLRRAMGKWRRQEVLFMKFSEKIRYGMRARGYNVEFIEQLLEQIHGFGSYGFPQSHAASFAHLVYVSAWLKRHYPACFAASLLNSQPMGFYRPSQIIQDAQRHGVEVKPVDITSSRWDCTIEQGALRLGLCMVKGLRREAAWRIEGLKAGKKWRSIAEFWRASKVSLSVLRCLARADAFSSLGVDRQRALWEIARFTDKPLPLFPEEKQADDSSSTALPLQKLEHRVLADYAYTGHSLKAHPIALLRSQLNIREVQPVKALHDTRRSPTGLRCRAAGIVLVRQRPSTAKGTLFLTIEDESGMLNCIVWESVMKQYRDPICDASVLQVEGRLQRAYNVLHLVVEEVEDISFLLAQYAGNSRDFH